MTCGDLGFKNATGAPCGQAVSSAGDKPCRIHAPELYGGPSLHSIGGHASWTSAARQARQRRKRFMLDSPERHLLLLERAAGALQADPTNPSVQAYAEQVTRLAATASKVWELVHVDRRLKALEAGR